MTNPCHKQPWGSYCNVNLVGFDVTIHAKITEEARDVAKLYWYHFKDLLPFMGHVDQLNLDIDSNMLLEITGAQLDPLGGTQDCKCDILI